MRQGDGILGMSLVAAGNIKCGARSMAAYAVYETKDARHLPLAERVGGLTFVKDGFHWGAFLLSGLWLVWKGQWRALLVWSGALILAGAAVVLLGFGFESLVALWLAAALVVGFEAAGFERDRLEAEAAQEIGYVAAGSRVDCEAAAVARLATRIGHERQDAGAADA